MAKKIDFILLGAALGLLIFGILMLASVSAPVSQEKFGNTYYYLKHQLFNVFIGLILGFLAYKINLNLLKKFALFLILGNLLLMLLVFIPGLGISAGGAARWLNLGFTSVQPSEFLKLTFIIYLASWLNTRISEKNMNRTKEGGSKQNFLAFMVLLAIIGIFLLSQPDMSTFIIILAVAIILYFIAQTPVLHIIMLFLLGIGGSIILAPLESYRLKRILVFLNQKSDPLGIGYQINQASIAIGSGGIFGLGLGLSKQSNFLPESMTDSIFAMTAEATGFFGCLMMILLLLIFFWRGFAIGKNSHDNFSKLAAFGISSWILIQSLINISSMVGLFPLAGIPLPFFSYGGSAIIAELIAVGVLLNISKTQKT